MPPETKRILGYTVAFEPPADVARRQMALMLAASLARTYFEGDFFVLHNHSEPLFRVQRAGIEEIPVETGDLGGKELADLADRWKFEAASVFSPETIAAYDAVLCLDVCCLALRNLDHLFAEDDWDILYQKENVGIWTVRAPLYHEVMDAWRNDTQAETETSSLIEIFSGCPDEPSPSATQEAWNRIVANSLPLERANRKSWRARPFEAHEIQFPLNLDPSWLHYRDAALLHCKGAPLAETLQFMFGIYMQTFFHDPQGTVIALLDR